MNRGATCPECGHRIFIKDEDFDDNNLLCKCCPSCDVRLVFNDDFVKGITARKYKGVGKDKINFGEWIKKNRDRLDWAWGTLYEDY